MLISVSFCCCYRRIGKKIANRTKEAATSCENLHDVSEMRRMTRFVILMCALFCLGNCLHSFKFLLGSDDLLNNNDDDDDVYDTVVDAAAAASYQQLEKQHAPTTTTHHHYYYANMFALVADTLLHSSLALHFFLNYSFNAKFRTTLRRILRIDLDSTSSSSSHNNNNNNNERCEHS